MNGYRLVRRGWVENGLLSSVEFPQDCRDKHIDNLNNRRCGGKYGNTPSKVG